MAIDQWYERKQEDSCGDFYRKIMAQGTRNDFAKTTQGKYAVAPDGTLLGETNHRVPERLTKMLESALGKFVPGESEAIPADSIDEMYSRTIPKNGLVVRANTKVLGGYEPPKNEWERIFQNAIARDNLWINEKEKAALVDGKFPAKLAQRLARFNLVDNTRGEPPMWQANEIRRLDLEIDSGVVRGTFHLETDDKQRGFEGEIFGHIAAKNGQLSRFDLVAKGMFWGEGSWTTRAPDGKFPIAAAFRLANGNDAADKVAPQGTKGWLGSYWE